MDAEYSVAQYGLRLLTEIGILYIRLGIIFILYTVVQLSTRPTHQPLPQLIYSTMHLIVPAMAVACRRGLHTPSLAVSRNICVGLEHRGHPRSTSLLLNVFLSSKSSTLKDIIKLRDSKDM